MLPHQPQTQWSGFMPQDMPASRDTVCCQRMSIQNGRSMGYVPQAYSMAGLILSGVRLSRNWKDRYWHD
jgi:hypothetical protein